MKRLFRVILFAMFNSLVQVFHVFEGNCPSVASVAGSAPACPTPVAQGPERREALAPHPVLPDRAGASLPSFCLGASSVSRGRDGDGDVQTGRPGVGSTLVP